MKKRLGAFVVAVCLLASAIAGHAVEQSTWAKVKKSASDEPVAAAKGAPPAKGTVKPYQLAVEVLQDVNQSTDVIVTTNVILGNYTAPTLSKHIQLKSFDASGDLRWTKNEKDVTLNAGGSTSTVTFQYGDMMRFQPVQVRSQVQNAQTGNTEVMEAKGIVRLRPDVTVKSVTAPAQVRVGQLVNIVAAIDEMNGDLGAMTNVVLSEGGTERDRTNGVAVGPLGNVGVVFTTQFNQVGTYELTLVAQDVTPGDYDASNNTGTVTIEVTGDAQPVPFDLYYYAYDYQYDYEYNYWDYEYQYSSIYHDTYQYQYLYEYLWLSDNALTFPVDKVSFEVSTDNVARLAVEATNIPASYDYTDGCTSQAAGSQDLGSGVYVYLQTYNDCGGYSFNYAYTQHYANHRTYFSSYYQYYYGTVYNSTDSSEYHDGGNIIPATDRVDTRMIVEDDGQAYGGDASIESLTRYEDVYHWSDSYGYYNYRYTETYGYSNGVTQP